MFVNVRTFFSNMIDFITYEIFVRDDQFVDHRITNFDFNVEIKMNCKFHKKNRNDKFRKKYRNRNDKN